MVERSPFISIVIPARNEEKYLGRCLRSLMQQDYTGNYEMIVVDNASTDHTYEVASSFGIKVVTEDRIGTCWARQRGVVEARGEIVSFIDADTMAPAHWLRAQVHHLTRDSKLVGVTGPYAFFDVSDVCRIASRIMNFIFIILDNFFRVVTRKGTTIWGANFAMKRQVLLEVGGFNTGIKFWGDDYELSLRLKSKGRVKLIPGLFVLTSVRRLREHGIVCTYWNYVVNYFSVLFWHKPLSPALEDMPGKLMRAITNKLMTRSISGKVISHGSRDRQVIALTFDDGPNEPFTSQILDILRERNIKATFFLLGRNARRFPEVCRRIVLEGHAVGNHSYSHSRWLALETERQIGREVQLAQTAIYKASGVAPKLFRPPYGFRTPWMLRSVRKLGLEVITWDNMTSDWNSANGASDIVTDIVAKIWPGGIIVLHDGRDRRKAYDRSSLIKALPIIITGLTDQGYRFVTVEELQHDE
jgi:peptidoglycan-N-acetylglucosamine deacetylase